MRHTKHLDMAFKLLTMNSNCKQQQDACVIVSYQGNVLGTGTVGVPPTFINTPCNCRGNCRSSSAIARAIAACGSRIGRAYTLYCIHAPDPDEIPLLVSLPIEEIVFAIDDPASPANMLWTRHGRTWTHHPVFHSTLKDIDNDDPDNP